jgi:hypothetical protein
MLPLESLSLAVRLRPLQAANIVHERMLRADRGALQA